MIDDYHFLREPAVDVNAAILGVGMGNWAAQRLRKSSDRPCIDAARRVMAERRFDLLPVLDYDGKVRRFFATTQWGAYESISLRSISYVDVMPLQTHVREVICSLALNVDRLFYFLSNEQRICGLLTIADLNNRASKIFLFGLISELEIELSRLIEAHLSDDVMLGLTLINGDDRRFQQAKVKYQQVRQLGLEGHFSRHLYFSDLIQIVAQEGLFRRLSNESESQFRRRFASVKSLTPVQISNYVSVSAMQEA